MSRPEETSTGLHPGRHPSQGPRDSLPLTPLQRLTLPSYGHIMYLVKFFVPTHLSGLYPYPIALRGQWSTPFTCSLRSCSWRPSRSRSGTPGGCDFRVRHRMVLRHDRAVLQWVPVGEAIMADRYTVPSVFRTLLRTGHGSARSWPGTRRRFESPAGGGGLLVPFVLVRSTARQSGDVEGQRGALEQRNPAPPESEMAYVSRGKFRGQPGRIQEAM